MPQNVTAVLSEALGRTGASAVPYAAEFRFLVQQHVTDLVGVRRRVGAAWRHGRLSAGMAHPECVLKRGCAPPLVTARCRRPLPQDLPSLHVKTREYVHTDGRCARITRPLAPHLAAVGRARHRARLTASVHGMRCPQDGAAAPG